MPYLRLTADRRGYENTFLMHVPGPGEPARVLYWHRTAPGVRIGRAALDDAAMRWLEEQYPDIDFDWHDILDQGAVTPVEVEPPLPPRKRRTRPAEGEPADASDATTSEPGRELRSGGRRRPADDGDRRTDAPDASDVPAASPASSAPDLLVELVGRGIAGSLRQRFHDVAAAVDGAPVDEAARASWRAALAPLDPDGWTSPDAILAGVAAFEPGIDAVSRQLEALSPDPPPE